MQEETDISLVMQALADNKQAFTLLIERYQDMALLLAWRITRDQEVAYELVQEAFLQAYLSLHRLHDPARFKSWLYGIVLNLCHSWRREQANAIDQYNYQYAQKELFAVDPVEIVEEHELHQVLHEAISILSPNNRSVVQLFYYEDHSIQYIASLLHISPTAVRNRLFKGRAQIRAYLSKVYPDRPIAPPRQYRRTTMVPMTLARVQQDEHLQRTTLILVDKSQQRALVLWFLIERDFIAQTHMFASTRQRVATTEPHATDFIISIIQALHGTIQTIEIDTLQDDILYARVKLSGPDGAQQSINARLENALPLAIASHYPITIAENIVEHQSIILAEFGETFEQQIEALANQTQHGPLFGSSQTLSPTKVPRNMNFTDGFRGWSFMGYPETPKLCEYELDSTVTFKNKSSLAITIHDSAATPEIATKEFALLMHEGFSASNYCGKRLRMLAFARAKNVKKGCFNLHINGYTTSDEMGPHQSMYMTNNQHAPIEGTHDWKQYELVIDVPNDAASIQYGFSMQGSGKVWLDGFQFEIVDNNVPLTGTHISPAPRQPANLTFTQNFDGWTIAGSCPQDYLYTIKATEQSSSVASIHNASQRPRGNIMLRQIINTYDYRGKTVHFSAMLQAKSITRQASLYLTRGRASDARIERTLQDTTDWQKYEVIMDIPDELGSIEFGVTLYGAGQLNMRDVQLFTRQEN